MKPVFLNKIKKKYAHLVDIEKEASEDNAHKVARRIKAVLLNMDGVTAPQIAAIIEVSRSQVSEWLRKYKKGGVEGLLEGGRTGRPPKLNFNQLNSLVEILRKGPAACGYNATHWTLAMISNLIKKNYQIKYHPGHIRKMLHFLGFPLRVINKEKAPAGLGDKELLKKLSPDMTKIRWQQKPF